MRKKNDGSAFHDFVVQLEKALVAGEGITVESRKRLVDKDTGRLREHDVVLTVQVAHHRTRTAIECKDTGRKVGVPTVEGFAKKCEKTGVHRGILVSASGFTKTARVKAAALNIECMELTQAASFDWLATEAFVGRHRNVDHVDVSVFTSDELPTEPFVVLDAADTEMTTQHFANIVLRALDQPATQFEGWEGVRPVKVHVNTQNWHVVGADGKRLPVNHVKLDAKVSMQHFSHPITLHDYRGDDTNYAIASTSVDIAGFKGKLMMIRDEENISVVWTPGSSPEPPNPDK